MAETKLARVEEHPFGITWQIDEPGARTSHALRVDGRVWIVDPVEHPAALERIEVLGPVAGVLQLIDRHNRDCAAIAGRLGVPHLRVPSEVPGTPLEVVRVVDNRRWREVALWWPEGWEGDALYSPPHSDINGSLRSGTTVLAQSSDASAAFERMTSRPADPEAVSLRISGSYLPHGDQTVYWFAIATPVPTLKIPPPLKPIEPVRRIPPGS